jgi:hypothetical protein
MFDGREATDEEDYDLLTYAEAGTRLDQEISRQRARLAKLESGAESGDGSALAACRERLAALEESRERNKRRVINDENFERFFGYPAKPAS